MAMQYGGGPQTGMRRSESDGGQSTRRRRNRRDDEENRRYNEEAEQQFDENEGGGWMEGEMEEDDQFGPPQRGYRQGANQRGAGQQEFGGQDARREGFRRRGSFGQRSGGRAHSMSPAGGEEWGSEARGSESRDSEARSSEGHGEYYDEESNRFGYSEGGPFGRSSQNQGLGHGRRNRGFRGGEERSEEGRHAGKGPKGYRRSNERIMEEINDRLTEHEDIDPSDVEVKVEDGEVTLTGTVDDRRSKRLAEDIAQEVSGVTEVLNQIRVRREKTAESSGRSKETST